MHFKLYECYVKETNDLTARIHQLVEDGKVDQEEMPAALARHGRRFHRGGENAGVGWTVCYLNPTTADSPIIGLHCMKQAMWPASPVLVMDEWEHAFILDYKPSERLSYIEAFFPTGRPSRLDWIARSCRRPSCADMVSTGS